MIFSPVRWPLDRLLKKGVYGAVVFFFFSILFVCVLFALYSRTTVQDPLSSGGSTQQGMKRAVPYEMIGLGPLALRQTHALGWVARLADELVIIAYNSRPDVHTQEVDILLGLKNGKQQLSVLNGKPLHLRESEEGRGLLTSEEPTGLWVKPILLDGGSVLIEVGRKLVSKEGVEGEEKGQFIASVQGAGAKQLSATRDYVQDLQSAVVFPQDVLVQRYGGREFGFLGQKSVVDVTTQWSAYGLFLSAGDYLLYEGKEWRMVSFEELKLGSPIAKVTSVSDKGLEIDVWDERGYFPAKVNIEMKRPTHPPFGPEAMPSAVRLRTGTQVSCAFGKRRLILKQGDWILKTQGGWRNLHGTEDLALYLERRTKGDLFVFDSIEKDAQGKCVMKGHLFDETRTYFQPVNLPINVDKQQSKSSGKRRSAVANGNRGVK